jgi:hypothetical protein
MELLNDLGGETMELLNDLGSDVALSILVERINSEKLDVKEILPLISRIREILEPISLKDHSHSTEHFEVAEVV